MANQQVTNNILLMKKLSRYYTTIEIKIEDNWHVNDLHDNLMFQSEQIIKIHQNI